MIPLTLKLKNFLSYSSELQTIDFRPYPIICLSGKNGHGKSAMLDAITWAIWGQARKGISTPKPDQGLVRIGQTRVHVSLEFQIKDQIYRVSRDFFNSGMKSGATLEFQIFDPNTLTYKSLTDKTIKDTQNKIIDTIGLDFETFINTSFFKQGCSNEFSKKTPKERKQIICSILGLEKYDKIATQASTRAKEILSKSELIQNINARLKKETEFYQQIVQELAMAKKVLVDKQSWIARETSRHQDLQKGLANTTAEKKLCLEFQEKVKTWQDKRAELSILNKQLADQINVQALQESLKALNLEQKQLNKQIGFLQEKSNELFVNKNKLSGLRDSFSKAMESAKEECRAKIDQSKSDAHKLILLHDQNNIVLQNLTAQIQTLQDELKTIQKAMASIQGQKSQAEAVCPTCKQKLSGQAMLECMEREELVLRSKQELTEKALSEKEKEANELAKNIELQVKKIALIKGEYQELVAHYKQTFDPALFEQNFQAQEEVVSINNLILALEKEQSKMPTLQSQTKTNNLMLEKIHTQLEMVIDSQKAESKRQTMTIELLKELREISSKQEPMKTLEKEMLEKEAKINQELFLLNSSLEQARREMDDLHKTIGRLEHEKVKLDGFENEIKSNSEQIVGLEQEASDYQILANAYGKNGIQALMVESVIPEIELEANKILGALSQENSRIYIEPLKDLKKGGFKESLDIKIFDSAGVRSYEMFSGGEAFRIDFALRIGISKLLAKRAGAQLQTLIIDEGFGSQDTEGLARLIEGIHMIKNDFKKIIIVSHLSEFKDEFPVHFVVNKTSSGSTVAIQTRM